MDKLTVKNLDLYYGQFQALKNVNLDMKENEITAFIRAFRMRKIHSLKNS